MESKAEDVNLSVSVESSTTSTTNELGALTLQKLQNAPQQNDNAGSDVNILNSQAEIVISEIHANKKDELIIEVIETINHPAATAASDFDGASSSHGSLITISA